MTLGVMFEIVPTRITPIRAVSLAYSANFHGEACGDKHFQTLRDWNNRLPSKKHFSARKPATIKKPTLHADMLRMLCTSSITLGCLHGGCAWD